jgi:C-terminal processing protease CtpA/Prc
MGRRRVTVIRMMSRKAELFAWIVGAGLSAAATHAQTRLPAIDTRSLGFEREPVAGIPEGWYGIPPQTIASDRQVVHGGKRSLRLERGADSPGTFSFVARNLPLDFAGKTIELRGWLRREGEGLPSLWLRQDAEQGSVAFVDMSANPTVSTEWQQYSIAFDVKQGARQLVIGVRLSGLGKAWADDLELRVDGVKLPALPDTPIDVDQEFASGSKITLRELSKRQLDTLALTAKVWGFVKYHHPAVTGGTQHWDFALLRQLPGLLASRSPIDTQKMLVTWIDSLGPVAACPSCATVDANWAVKPRLAWLDDARLLGTPLRARLKSIYDNRRGGEQFYVRLLSNASNAEFRNEPAYSDVKLPDGGFQLLTVFRFWNMVEYWFPYRDLIDENWDAVLRDSLMRVGTAQDLATFRREVAALVARVDDGHANASYGLGIPPEGDCLLPVHVRYIQGQFVVKSLWEGAQSDLRIGDVLVAIDGRPVGAIVGGARPYYGSSNENSRLARIARVLARGACGDVKITVTRDTRVEINAKRVPVDWTKLGPDGRNDRPGETFQWLTPKIGYLKLSTYKAADAAKYVRELANADGLVVDIRNYPAEFAVFSLGNLLVDEPTTFVQFTKADLANPGTFLWGAQVNLEPAQPRFSGHVAILVDETSISQSEYTTMALAASPRAIVVGSQTAGADGNVSPVMLPANVRTGLSGLGVYYPDHAPTQQVGVQIDIPCQPTIAGIRAGRDEVLDCALEALTMSGAGDRGNFFKKRP